MPNKSNYLESLNDLLDIVLHLVLLGTFCTIGALNFLGSFIVFLIVNKSG